MNWNVSQNSCSSSWIPTESGFHRMLLAMWYHRRRRSSMMEILQIIIGTCRDLNATDVGLILRWHRRGFKGFYLFHVDMPYYRGTSTWKRWNPLKSHTIKRLIYHAIKGGYFVSTYEGLILRWNIKFAALRDVFQREVLWFFFNNVQWVRGFNFH